ncbi:MAG: transglutaminase-like cysteine peptidase [Bradyrhizobium sp.]
MGYFGNGQAWRAIVLAWVLVWFGPAANLNAGTLISPGALDSIRKSAEPFGLFATRLSGGGLLEKWNGVEHKLEDEMVQLALCDGDRERCVSPAALQFLAIVDAARAREGRARFGEINRAINLAIKPMSDLAQYGQIDVWSSPLVTFTSGAGDCEDYAIAKMVALRMAGVSTEDIRLVVLRDVLRGEDHAVVLARLDGHWLTLDNRRLAMIEDIDVRNHRPLFVIGDSGVMRYDQQSPSASAAWQASAPAVAVNLAGAPISELASPIDVAVSN